MLLIKDREHVDGLYIAYTLYSPQCDPELSEDIIRDYSCVQKNQIIIMYDRILNVQITVVIRAAAILLLLIFYLF